MLCTVDVENIANSILSSLPHNITCDKVLWWFCLFFGGFLCFGLVWFVFLEKTLIGISGFNLSSNKRQKMLINLCHLFLNKGESSVNNVISSATGKLCDLINCISIPSGFVVKTGMQQEKGTCSPRYSH